MLKLYGYGPMRSLRTLWALNELGVDFEFVSVNLFAGETQHPDFLRLNPAGKIPVLVDGDLIVTESAAIVLYLADKHSAKGLLPASIAERAQVYRWILFAVTELEQPLWRIAKHTSIYAEENRLPRDVALARDEFLRMAAVMDGHMAGREFLAGDRISAADCVAAYTLDWANEAQLLGGFVHLSAYLDRMYARSTAPQRIAAAFTSLG